MAITNKIKLALFAIFALIFLGWAISGTVAKALGDSVTTEYVPPALIANAVPDDYVGSETCKACHEDQFKKVSFTVHGKLTNSTLRDKAQSCESCHGPGKAHSETGEKASIISFKDKKRTPEQNSQVCITCHSQTSTHASWRGSKHESSGVSCLSCHSAHNSPALSFVETGAVSDFQAETKLLIRLSVSETCYTCHTDVRKSEYQRSTHLFKNEDRESRMSCSSCHDPHGSTSEKQMKSTSVNETCYSCHAEKRGPFLWEHAPARENCSACHKAHGSNHLALLKSRTPMLCQQCHIQGRHQTIAGKPISAFMKNRSCNNCHSQIHGSNHPSGFNLQR